MEITEKWLGEIGGWQAMKAARMLVSAGRVQVTERTSNVIRGYVGGEKSRLNSGLLVRARSDVENLCTCAVARRTGQICEHSLAVGLASLASADVPRVEGSARLVGLTSDLSCLSEDQETNTAPSHLSLYLPESLFEPGNTKNKGTTAFLKLETGEAETSRLAGWLNIKGVPYQNAPIFIPSTEIGSLFLSLVDHPRVFIGKPSAGMHRPLMISGAEMRPLVRVKYCEGGESSNASISLRLTETPAPQLILIGKNSAWLYHIGGGIMHPWRMDSEGELGRLARDLLIDVRPGEEVLRPIRWMPTQLAAMEEVFQVELESDLNIRFKVLKASPKFSIEVSGSLQKVQLKIIASFQSHEWLITSHEDPFPVQDQHSELLFYVRNINLEKSLFDDIRRRGFELCGSKGIFQLAGTSEVIRFFATGLPRIQDGYSVTETDDWRQATQKLQRISPTVNQPSKFAKLGNDWLTLEFAYEAPNGFRISRSDALRLIRSGQNTVKGRDGLQYILDSERCEELEEAFQDVPVQMSAEEIRVGSAHAGYFSPFANRSELASTNDSAAVEAGWLDRLGDLASVLRPYQFEGVAWIVQRLKAGQGAMLGDDMGLGKTLQSIASIRYMFSGSPRGIGQQALVVCPKSLVSNWRSEFKRFAPELRVLLIQGPNRKELFDQFNDYEVLITSYPLIVRDLAFYQNLEFAVIVFDESSFVKNPDTETAKALRSLRSRSRLALSGTPVENGVRDLWSVFEILLPGYLGSRRNFQERFEKPLESQTEKVRKEAIAMRLKRLIRPFFLRRTKHDVLKEIPEKSEQVFWCEMSIAQEGLYRTILEEGREEVRSLLQRSGQNSARMTMLTVLLRLRQVCCDMRLVGVHESQLCQLDSNDLSGKWMALDALLDGVLTNGGKVLVFSQFVSYLRLCQEHLNERGIGYSYLDGATQDRDKEVSDFQLDPSRSVFLISLKAGGYGLNLTQADNVFLMDPWWNPAVEAQAIDRAHRFGQTKTVRAYRFVMRGTVEERVVALQERKRGLITSMMEDQAPMMEGLNDTDLEELLDL